MEERKRPSSVSPQTAFWGKKRFKMPSAVLWASSAEGLFLFLRLSRSAERSKRIFTQRGRKGKMVTYRFSLLKAGRRFSCSAALSQKVALQMLFFSTTPPVKMGYRNARRRYDIPKFKIILPLNMARAQRKPFKIVLLAKEAAAHRLCSGSFIKVAYFRLKVAGSKSGSSQLRVMISVRSFRMAMECSK